MKYHNIRGGLIAKLTFRIKLNSNKNFLLFHFCSLMSRFCADRAYVEGFDTQVGKIENCPTNFVIEIPANHLNYFFHTFLSEIKVNKA